MIFTPEISKRLMALAACLAVALIGTGRAASPEAARFIAAARLALDRSDGIAAEAELRRALDAGATREEVAATMGDALLQQGALDKARSWLAEGQFAPADESYGWRMLGRLERMAGYYPAAGQAYDRALRITPNDAQLWVDIARLRYAGGEQIEAVEAADHALALNPGNPRALEFRGALIRDQYGLVPALPWFEAGLKQRPDDLPLLGEYAATLGELGRAKEMLRTTRRMLELDPGSARALYLQAVLAARAGKMDLARALLGRTDRIASVPAAMLLRGVLELQAGNPNLAIDVLDRLVRQQPANASARLLLARAAAVAEDRAQLFSAHPDEAAGSPYLLTLQARWFEDRGQRRSAATLLSRVGMQGSSQPRPIIERSDLVVLASDWAERADRIGAGLPYIRKLIGAGSLARAGAIAERLRTTNPGSADAQAVAGDVRLLQDDPPGALARYQIAAKVRVTPDLAARLALALDRASRSKAADEFVEAQLAGSPTDRRLNRLAAARAARRGDWRRVLTLLEYLAPLMPRDPALLDDLAEARLRLGDRPSATRAAASAYLLQRGSEIATRRYAETAAGEPADVLNAKATRFEAR